MAAFQFVLVIALVALTARSQQNSPQEPSAQPQPVLPASCPITRRPAKEFIAPIPYVRDENSFWLGTEPGSDPGHCRRKIAVTRIELRSKGVNRLVYKRGCQEHFSASTGGAVQFAPSSPLAIASLLSCSGLGFGLFHLSSCIFFSSDDADQFRN